MQVRFRTKSPREEVPDEVYAERRGDAQATYTSLRATMPAGVELSQPVGFDMRVCMQIKNPTRQVVQAALSGVRRLGDTCGLAWLEAADDVLITLTAG